MSIRIIFALTFIVTILLPANDWAFGLARVLPYDILANAMKVPVWESGTRYLIKVAINASVAFLAALVIFAYFKTRINAAIGSSFARFFNWGVAAIVAFFVIGFVTTVLGSIPYGGGKPPPWTNLCLLAAALLFVRGFATRRSSLAGAVSTNVSAKNQKTVLVMLAFSGALCLNALMPITRLLADLFRFYPTDILNSWAGLYNGGFWTNATLGPLIHISVIILPYVAIIYFLLTRASARSPLFVCATARQWARYTLIVYLASLLMAFPFAALRTKGVSEVYGKDYLKTYEWFTQVSSWLGFITLIVAIVAVLHALFPKSATSEP